MESDVVLLYRQSLDYEKCYFPFFLVRLFGVDFSTQYSELITYYCGAKQSAHSLISRGSLYDKIMHFGQSVFTGAGLEIRRSRSFVGPCSSFALTTS